MVSDCYGVITQTGVGSARLGASRLTGNDGLAGCLKDLKRFWRMDEKDDDRTVARIFHDVGVLERDLIPILFTTLGTGPKGDRIALACGELQLAEPFQFVPFLPHLR